MPEYNVHKILSDGNCMFRVISLSMYGTEENHSIIRSRIVDHIVINWNLYHPLVVGDTSYNILITNKL